MPVSAQFRMIAWTLVAVLIGGAGVVFSLMQPPRTIQVEHDAPKTTPVVIETPDVDSEIDGRAPASTQSKQAKFSAVALDDQGARQAVDLTMPCSGKSLFADTVTQVRLIGTLCGKTVHERKDVLVKSEIKNQNNGYLATVFVTSGRSFETDYISLAPGVNRLHIAHTYKSGATEESDFMIERQPASLANAPANVGANPGSVPAAASQKTYDTPAK